ncbi:glutamate receptor ionotropic, delta-1 [Caerostris darwini]|uniref:Glutamate receptor ionotropic, delta-1 n=1 Tax=Caerostris darwini TaxID=1538125 RepID=A0AAV4TPP1_9ARAC|nr:glutamate receptor ionotropic, delta-1 [Caerostris darwini]
MILSGLTLSRLNAPVYRSEHNMEGFLKRALTEIRRLLELLISQGGYDRYKSLKVRVFMYFWSLSKLILVLSYSCDLLAGLMIPSKETPLRTVQELRDAVVAGKYQFGAFTGTSHLGSMMETKSGIVKDLADHLRQHPENILRSFDDSLERLQSEKFAVMNMRLHFLYSAGKIGLDKFYISSDNFGYNVVCVAFGKGFPHMEAVNRIIIRIWECGIQMKILMEYTHGSNVNAQPSKSTEDRRALSMSHMKTGFWALFIGQILSILCFILEICAPNYKAFQANRIYSRKKSNI